MKKKIQFVHFYLVNRKKITVSLFWAIRVRFIGVDSFLMCDLFGLFVLGSKGWAGFLVSLSVSRKFCRLV